MTPVEHFMCNLTMSVEALELARALGRGRAILASSAGVFGAHQTGPLPESLRPEGRGMYALAKRTADELVQASYELGCDVVAVRFGDLYGGDEIAGHRVHG